MPALPPDPAEADAGPEGCRSRGSIATCHRDGAAARRRRPRDGHPGAAPGHHSLLRARRGRRPSRPSDCWPTDWGVDADAVVGHLVQVAPRGRDVGRAVEPAPPRRGPSGSRSSPSAWTESEGPIVAVTDFMRAVPDQVARWMPRRFTSLGHRRLRPLGHPRRAAPLLRGRRRPPRRRRAPRPGRRRAACRPPPSARPSTATASIPRRPTPGRPEGRRRRNPGGSTPTLARWHSSCRVSRRRTPFSPMIPWPC